MSLRQRAGYILHYYRFWLMGLVLLLAVGFYIGDAVVQSQKEILLQGFFTNDEYTLFPAENIQKDYAATQALTRRQRIVFDDALYIDLGGDASDYTSASNGKLIAYKEVEVPHTNKVGGKKGDACSFQQPQQGGFFEMLLKSAKEP